MSGLLITAVVLGSIAIIGAIIFIVLIVRWRRELRSTLPKGEDE